MLREPDLADAAQAAHRASRAAGIAHRLRWRVNRLRCMEPAEVAHRVGRLLAAQAERAGLLHAEPMPDPDSAPSSHTWVHAAPGVDPAPYLAAANRIAAGELQLFALEVQNPRAAPRWNRDPKTGIEAPLGFGKLLDYRDPRRVGDIKYLWELNRHLHLVTLAQAYALGRDARYLAVIRQHLESWFSACPCGRGPNWSSALEAAIRLINWSIAWQLIGGDGAEAFAGAEGARFRRRWLQSVYEHARFVRGFLSRHSSANNHLIGEAAGLYIAALTWPCWPALRASRATAKAILEGEALRQNAADGVNREQAVCYQQFVFDFLLLSRLAAKAHGECFSTACASRMDSMLGFLASVMDAGGNVPMLGDGDDGIVARLSQEPVFCPYRSQLATGALLFGNGAYKRKAGALDDKTRWLLGAQAAAQFERIDMTLARVPTQLAFTDGGYYILGRDFETPEEIRLVADAGPLGYLSIAAHGHADALAFTLSVGGVEFLVDPGTYAYHGRSAWRDYFRGTSAHNTLRIDGRDQSQAGGNFLWLTKANAGCSQWRTSDERDEFEAWHDGYAHLPDPVMHRRRITLDKAARRVLIEDRLEMAGTHDVELFFHCSENCTAERGAGGVILTQGPKEVVLKLPQAPGGSLRTYFGSVSPICGWVSRNFDRKRPSPSVVWRAQVTGNCLLRSEIMC